MRKGPFTFITPCFLSFGGFLLSTKHVCLICLEYVWGSKGLFVASYFCYFVVLVFGKEPFSVQVFLVPAFFGLVVFSVCVLLVFVLRLVWCFLRLCLVSFQFTSSSWDSLFFTALSSCCFFYFMSWPLVFACRVAACLFMGTVSGGRLGMANREGSI